MFEVYFFISKKIIYITQVSGLHSYKMQQSIALIQYQVPENEPKAKLS